MNTQFNENHDFISSNALLCQRYLNQNDCQSLPLLPPEVKLMQTRINALEPRNHWKYLIKHVMSNVNWAWKARKIDFQLATLVNWSKWSARRLLCSPNTASNANLLIAVIKFLNSFHSHRESEKERKRAWAGEKKINKIYQLISPRTSNGTHRIEQTLSECETKREHVRNIVVKYTETNGAILRLLYAFYC